MLPCPVNFLISRCGKPCFVKKLKCTLFSSCCFYRIAGNLNFHHIVMSLLSGLAVPWMLLLVGLAWSAQSVWDALGCLVQKHHLASAGKLPTSRQPFELQVGAIQGEPALLCSAISGSLVLGIEGRLIGCEQSNTDGQRYFESMLENQKASSTYRVLKSVMLALVSTCAVMLVSSVLSLATVGVALSKATHF